MTKTQPLLPSAGLAVKSRVGRKRSHVAATQAVLGKNYSRSLTYNSYQAMLKRCYRPSCNGFRNYGGRGITVCERWKDSYVNFVADLGHRPEGKVLDRIDVNGHYEPGNCRWVTRVHSIRNKRNVSVPFIEGESKQDRKRRTGMAWYRKNRERLLAVRKTIYYSDLKAARARVLDSYYRNKDKRKSRQC